MTRMMQQGRYNGDGAGSDLERHCEADGFGSRGGDVTIKRVGSALAIVRCLAVTRVPSDTRTGVRVHLCLGGLFEHLKSVSSPPYNNYSGALDNVQSGLLKRSEIQSTGFEFPNDGLFPSITSKLE
jgi:hypothetical protein